MKKLMLEKSISAVRKILGSLTRKMVSIVVLEKADGERTPRWYLPVCRSYTHDGYECWIFFLAPLILAGKILKNMWHSFWFDLVKYNENLVQWRNYQKTRETIIQQDEDSLKRSPQ